MPWSPLPTETRLVAMDACEHDFIIYLDHDECLNVDGIRWVKEHAPSHPGHVFRFPKCEYVMGVHDPDSYYWPMLNECQPPIRVPACRPSGSVPSEWQRAVRVAACTPVVR